jgi:ArsR family transcriptional regulator
MLERARQKLRAAGLGDADLRAGAMESLPVGDAEVDVVLANMALHHAEAPGDALAEMARVLRTGGRVVLTDLARHGLDWTREELGDAWPGFAPDELERRLAEAGFVEVSVEAVGTCTLRRRGAGEGHVVDVLLATGTKGS